MTALPTALFVSPHLDDVTFSCGGVAAALAERGWRTVLATVFTRSVVPASGFALACQLDKGIGASVDYMALRRDEDRAAASILGFAQRHDLDLLEAPHRGYNSAAALFAGVHDDDHVWQEVAARLTALEDALRPTVVLAPQGLGAHVDHLQVRHAVLECVRAPVWWYRDTPYAIRHTDAGTSALTSLTGFAIPVDASLERKLSAARAYRSQVDFQFGSAEQSSASLRDFAHAEASHGADLPLSATVAERFLYAGDPHSHPAYVTLHGVVP